MSQIESENSTVRIAKLKTVQIGLDNAEEQISDFESRITAITQSEHDIEKQVKTNASNATETWDKRKHTSL